MIPSQNLVVGDESGLAERERFGRLAICEEQAGQIAKPERPTARPSCDELLRLTLERKRLFPLQCQSEQLVSMANPGLK